MKLFELPGTRIIKTGVAIFLTALICDLLGWTPVFAVITAIVTLEPTVSDSIKKGLVRFPASAIGAAYAVFFIAIFGNSPITYTLAAIFTIATSYRLNLHAGLLVATITAVAMIEVVHDNYLISFLTRLGATSVGIIVSTVVNMFVLPPNYVREIGTNIKGLYKELGLGIKTTLNFSEAKDHQQITKKTLSKLEQKILKTEQLIRFQKDEAKFHPLSGNRKENFILATKQINQIKLMHYHLTNLNYIDLDQVSLSLDEKYTIEEAIEALANTMIKGIKSDLTSHEFALKQLMQAFWVSQNITSDKKIEDNLPEELVLLYELLSLIQLTSNYEI